MIFSIKIEQIWIVKTSVWQIVPSLIVWDNIMPKIIEIKKNDIENCWSIYMLKSVSFHFFHFRRKNLVMTKNLVRKNGDAL